MILENYMMFNMHYVHITNMYRYANNVEDILDKDKN